MKLYTMGEMSFICKLSYKTVRKRIRELHIEPKGKGFRNDLLYDYDDCTLVRLSKKIKINPVKTEIIRITNEYVYAESKINRTRNTYGTHYFNNRL